MNETDVKIENGKIVISDELREKLIAATGDVIAVDYALNQLANILKTGNESMKILAEGLKKLANKREKPKPKPTKPYWRTGERW